jgi:hypothetical protein
VSASDSDPGASNGTKTPGAGNLYPIVREDEVEPLNRSSPPHNGTVATEAIPLRRFDKPAAPDVQPGELETPIAPAAILTADQVRDPIYHARQSLLFDDDGDEAPRPARFRMTANEISRHGRQVLVRVRVAGVRLSALGAPDAGGDAGTRALILACIAVVLGLGAITVYHALGAGAPDATSNHSAKASARIIARSTTVDHSAARNPAFVTRKGSGDRRARRLADRTHPDAVHHRTRSAGRKRTTTSRSTTRSVSTSQHTYTSPAPVATPATPSPVQATSASTPLTSTSSSTKPPAFGPNGALGPGSSPDG